MELGWRAGRMVALLAFCAGISVVLLEALYAVMWWMPATPPALYYHFWDLGGPIALLAAALLWWKGWTDPVDGAGGTTPIVVLVVLGGAAASVQSHGIDAWSWAAAGSVRMAWLDVAGLLLVFAAAGFAIAAGAGRTVTTRPLLLAVASRAAYWSVVGATGEAHVGGEWLHAMFLDAALLLLLLGRFWPRGVSWRPAASMACLSFAVFPAISRDALFVPHALWVLGFALLTATALVGPVSLLLAWLEARTSRDLVRRPAPL